MPDLAKTETRLRALPDPTFRRETTLPRAPTDRPSREVNADLRRPNTANNAEALAKLLGVASDVTSNIVGDIKAKKDTEDAAQAAFDFSAGNQDAEKFQKSRAYARAWKTEGAKAKGFDAGQKMADAYTEVLNNPDATVEDVDAALEAVIHQETHDEKGNLLDFGPPEAKVALANTLLEAKTKLMASAHKAIQERQWVRLANTVADNKLIERARGAPLGDPKAATAVEAPMPDPLAPLPEKPQPTTVLERLSPPFKGFDTVDLTGRIGDSRGDHTHNGEDYPVPEGTPIKAPMGGKVIASFSNAEGGNQVRVQLANGAIVGFAHLSQRDVKVGDPVNAGDLLGLSGATGHATGPHVHMTVEVNGKKVSPRHYFSSHAEERIAVAATGTEPKLATPTPEPSGRPGFDFEGAMQAVPNSVPRGWLKDYLLKDLYARAAQSGDASILNGLEDSKRADGSPSFTPDEQLQIVNFRDDLRRHVRIETEQAKNRLQSDNADAVQEYILKGGHPTRAWLAAQVDAGLLSPSHALAFADHEEALQREAAREAEARHRDAERERESDLDVAANEEAAALSVGLVEGTSDNELFQRFRKGEFGEVGSKKAFARLNLLRRSLKAGQAATEQNPDFVRYATRLQTKFKPRSNKSSGAPLILQRQGGDMPEDAYKEMLFFYRDKVHQGEKPGDAYREAVKAYAPKAAQKGALTEVIAEEIAAMKARKRASGL